MENTDSLKFKNDIPAWFVAKQGQSEGPYFAAEVFKKIQNNEISWMDYIWKPGLSKWQRICDVKEFQQKEDTSPPPLSQIKEIKQEIANERRMRPRVKSAHPMQWYLYHQESQLGPFSEDEVFRFLRVGKIDGSTFAWRKGMKGWDRISKIELFSVLNLKANKKTTSEKRITPRQPLFAKVLLANDRLVGEGICRDVSLGGLQILTDKIPGKVGTIIKINVSPTQETPKEFESFVATAIVVRILEDQRGFSCRFEKMTTKSQKAIAHYLKTKK